MVSKLRDLYNFQLPDILVSREFEILRSQKAKNNDKKENLDENLKKESKGKNWINNL